MQLKSTAQSIMKWLPSLIIALIFIHNGMDKVLHADELDKIVKAPILIQGSGILLILSAILFLYPKTIFWGASILALYMTFIVGVHLFKGKPFELAGLVVISIIFATYLRTQNLFHLNDKV